MHFCEKDQWICLKQLRFWETKDIHNSVGSNQPCLKNWHFFLYLQVYLKSGFGVQSVNFCQKILFNPTLRSNMSKRSILYGEQNRFQKWQFHTRFVSNPFLPWAAFILDEKYGFQVFMLFIYFSLIDKFQEW